ncbi:hypothetical protein WDZ92_47645 [Nostoc sp. NIES-2111]
MVLIDKCHSSGFPVVCDGVPPTVGDRTPCWYYQVSLHGEDLGVWSELGVLSVLSGLQHEFYRPRLVPFLTAVATSEVAEVQQETVLG